MSLLSKIFKKKADPSPTASAEPVADNSQLSLSIPTLNSSAELPSPPGHIDRKDFLQMGIWYHENCDDLSVSTHYFAKACAEKKPLGMILYAISLRHGWGCEIDEKLAFDLLHKAADMAVHDFHRDKNVAQTGIRRFKAATIATMFISKKADPATDNSAATASSSLANDEMGYHTPKNGSSQLTLGDFSHHRSNLGNLRTIATSTFCLALAQIADSFRFGLGVEKSIDSYIYYLCIAAQLNDGDAQASLAENYLRGIGVKSSKRAAAKWFRKAERNGVKHMGMHWIWKSKYDGCEDEVFEGEVDV